MMGYALGIDVGSSFTKAVIFDGKTVVSHVSRPSGGNYAETARIVSDVATRRAGISRATIITTLSTGCGATAVTFADRTVTDISCHAVGMHYLFPDVRTVVDIGGRFSRAIRIDNSGKPISFVQNEKCAAGSGRFLQVIARILHVSFEELGDLAKKSTNPVEFTTGCAVFAESEVISRIAEGAKPNDIIAGVHKAIAAKIANLTHRIDLVEKCAITGGGAEDIGLIRAIEEELCLEVWLAEKPRFSAALGAALQGSYFFSLEQ